MGFALQFGNHSSKNPGDWRLAPETKFGYANTSHNTSTARKSLTLVKDGPVTTRSARAAK